MKETVNELRTVDGVRVDRATAVKAPFTKQQCVVIAWDLHTVEEEAALDTPTLGFKVWTVLVRRLLNTILDLRAEIARMRKELE